MKIVESDDDGLVFERAFVATDDDGVLVARCFFSGIPCQLGDKPGALEIGFVACWPLDQKFYDSWPMSVKVQEPEGLPQLMRYFTANPRAVQAARKFLELQAAGELEVGKAL